jgi:hypothetical protein
LSTATIISPAQKYSEAHAGLPRTVPWTTSPSRNNPICKEKKKNRFDWYLIQGKGIQTARAYGGVFRALDNFVGTLQMCAILDLRLAQEKSRSFKAVLSQCECQRWCPHFFVLINSKNHRLGLSLCNRRRSNYGLQRKYALRVVTSHVTTVPGPPPCGPGPGRSVRARLSVGLRRVGGS